MNKLTFYFLTSLIIVSNTTYAKDNWISNDGRAVRDGSGECIRNGVWTPATANPECIKDLAPKPQPVPAPTPKVTAPITPPPSPPVTKPVVMPTKITLQTDTFFDFDKSVIKPQGRVRLDEFVAQLGSVSGETIIVVGHTDSVGSDDYNIKLGQRRADAVRAYLISKGVKQTVVASSRGEREPIADNKTPQGRAKNRRVVIEISGTKK